MLILVKYFPQNDDFEWFSLICIDFPLDLVHKSADFTQCCHLGTLSTLHGSKIMANEGIFLRFLNSAIEKVDLKDARNQITSFLYLQTLPPFSKNR